MVALGLTRFVSDSPATPNLPLRCERQVWTCVPVNFMCDGHPVGSLRFERRYRGR